MHADLLSMSTTTPALPALSSEIDTTSNLFQHIVEVRLKKNSERYFNLYRQHYESITALIIISQSGATPTSMHAAHSAPNIGQ